MKKSVSIVQARRELGRLAEEVRRTGETIVLTRRGRPVARIAPQPEKSRSRRRTPRDAFLALRGTVRMNGSFAALQRTIRELRSDFAGNLDRRAAAGR